VQGEGEDVGGSAQQMRGSAQQQLPLQQASSGPVRCAGTSSPHVRRKTRAGQVEAKYEKKKNFETHLSHSQWFHSEHTDDS
jgi:hypothetical protein